MTVFIPDLPGSMAGVLKIMEDADVSFRAFTLDRDHLQIISEEGDAAERALRQHGYDAIVVHMVQVCVRDRHGELARLFTDLAEAKVNVEAGFGMGDGDEGCVYIRADNMDLARPILQRYELVNA